MGKNNRYISVVIVSLFVTFGMLCFLGGYLFSNLLAKKKQITYSAQLCERDERFVNVCSKVIDNTQLSFAVLEGISRRWKESLDDRGAFEQRLSEFLKTAKEALQKLEINNGMIEIGIRDVSKLSKQYTDAYAALMEMYGVYRQLYSMGLSPSGELVDFEQKIKALKEQFIVLEGKLVEYMPALKEKIKSPDMVPEAAPIDEAQQSAADSPSLKMNFKPVTGKPVFIEGSVSEETTGVPSQLQAVEPVAAPVAQPQPVAAVVSADMDQKIKDFMKKDIDFITVERILGMPLNKFRDAQKKEVWVYPSSRAGVRNYIYFSNLKVSSWKKITVK
ncbi:MAG TPA: hypothetical protein P5110_02470 [Candidatus Omnitrophota bacterium]|nr:hypothetical protein [Candidatus Omnitrophota bacterium]HRZ14351.1 hypothetical protein [Candidatus Omnitrophota bacterium]